MFFYKKNGPIFLVYSEDQLPDKNRCHVVFAGGGIGGNPSVFKFW